MNPFGKQTQFGGVIGGEKYVHPVRFPTHGKTVARKCTIRVAVYAVAGHVIGAEADLAFWLEVALEHKRSSVDD